MADKLKFRFSLGMLLWVMVLLSVVLALDQTGKERALVASFGAGAVIGICLTGGRGGRALAGGTIGGAVGGAVGVVIQWIADMANQRWQALPCGIIGTAILGAVGGFLLGAIHWFAGGICDNLKERYRARQDRLP